ncbi:hypothetical protein PROFUN_02305 [Planoprotostelium fungivorum]|uniref:Uridine 5'-monophosphate synthase n=1 Tax=Planoprotostelium fungivorum TaxID=1890364 RepID=A0A2P6NYJ4_9EUKA|nr:hypothetical protein PROFUN_02305 [Planoprotostelium fungivorum]
MAIETLEDVVLELHRINAVKFGQFKLKSGVISPFYIDLRLLPSYPQLLKTVAKFMWQKAEIANRDQLTLTGVPYTALPIATAIGIDENLPVLIVRKERKAYGTGNMVEGEITKGVTRTLILEDVVTSGGSVLTTAKQLEEEGIIVDRAVVFLNREQGGKENLTKEGYDLRSVIGIRQVLDILHTKGKLSDEQYKQAIDFISVPVPQPNAESTPAPAAASLSYTERAAKSKSELGAKLLRLMDEKKTNLALAADVLRSEELLRIAEEVGPEICILKTHVDILEDYEPGFPDRLREIADRHNFLIFEDRKFADIGNTVKHQYSGGVHRIAKWSDITNSHIVSGASSVASLKEVGKPLGRGLLLIAQMSTADANTSAQTVENSLKAAREHADFVFGFICQEKIAKEADDVAFVHMTPGVHLQREGDNQGQHYNTPQHVITQKKGITESNDRRGEAKRYREAGWSAYQSTLNH